MDEEANTRGSLECYYVKRTDRVYRIYKNVCGGVWLTQASVSCQAGSHSALSRERGIASFSSQHSGVRRQGTTLTAVQGSHVKET